MFALVYYLCKDRKTKDDHDIEDDFNIEVEKPNTEMDVTDASSVQNLQNPSASEPL